MGDTTIHIVDDDEAIRDSLAFLLDTAGHTTRTWASGEAFLAAQPVKGGCLLTDVRMPGISGLELAARLKETGFTMPIIVMTGHGDIPLAVEAMKAGVVDFLEKPLDDDLLLRAIKLALERAKAGDGDNAPEHRERFEALSPRERDVLAGVIAGKANKVIAYDLGISPRTVEVYRAGLMSKIGAGSVSELVRMAISAGVSGV